MFLVRTILKRSFQQTWTRSHARKPPKVRIGPDIFEISLDVRSYAHHELRIKAQADYLLIEGKQEREIDDGYVLRQFARKFKLPKGCSPDRMTSTLSPEGILTIAAERQYCDAILPCETLVPIKLHEGSPEEAISRKSKHTLDPCMLYKKIKVKPRPPDDITPDEKVKSNKIKGSNDDGQK